MPAETPTTPAVTLSVADGIGWIEIANPERLNAFTASMWKALPACIAEAEADDSCRVIILRGAGQKAFSAGADISEFETARSGDNIHAYDALNHAAFSAIIDAHKPTIAMIHGFCLGGGFGIAACCDLRLADDRAQFAIPPAKLGLGYNARWIAPLLSLAPPPVIKEMIFTGRRVPAAEGLAVGLVNRVLPEADLQAATRALAAEIAANAPLTIRAAKDAIDEIWSKPETPDIARLDEAVRVCFESEDYQEGRRAFLEKRKPVFKGR